MKFLTIIIVKFIYYITAIELSAKGLRANLIQMTAIKHSGIIIKKSISIVLKYKIRFRIFFL